MSRVRCAWAFMTSPENDPPPHDGVERIGTVISGRYLVKELLGEGGMGSVYLAEHTRMKKRVALKLLHPEMSENAEVQSRFEREAMASAHIEHPNVAAATDFGRTEDGAYFLVLEYVEGTSLRDMLESGPISVARALRITRQMALALERAHESGIVHRDLKPENVMLVKRDDEPDFVKVLDFGIAKVLELGAASASGDIAKRDVGQPLTRLGTILGTPEYMAPEQALGEAVTPAADLYGVGVMLYEMLTGKHPFDPPDRTAMLSFHIVAPVPLMQDRAPAVEVPASVEAVVRCLLEKDSRKRYAGARALIDAIDGAAKVSGIELSGAPGMGGMAPPPASDQEPWAPPDAFAQTTAGTPAPSLASMKEAVPPPAVRANEEGARVSVTDTLRNQPRKVLIAVAAALPVGFILVIVVVLLVTRRHGPPSFETEGGVASAAVRVKTASTDEVKAAVALGPEALEALVKEYPADATLPPKLVIAYQAQGRTADALRTLRALLAATPSAASDDELLLVASTAAVKGKGEDDDEAFALLEGPFGERGVDALIEISTGRGGSRAAERLREHATRSLVKPDVRAHAAPAAGILIDFRAAPGCIAKRELLPRVRDEGDARIVALVKPLKLRSGCGFLGRSDCFSCIKRDASLDAVIEAALARPAPK